METKVFDPLHRKVSISNQNGWAQNAVYQEIHTEDYLFPVVEILDQRSFQEPALA